MKKWFIVATLIVMLALVGCTAMGEKHTLPVSSNTVQYAVVSGSLPGVFLKDGFYTLDGKKVSSEGMAEGYWLYATPDVVGALQHSKYGLRAAYKSGDQWKVEDMSDVEYVVTVKGCLGVVKKDHTSYKVCSGGIQKTDKIPVYGHWLTPSDKDPVVTMEDGKVVNLQAIQNGLLGASIYPYSMSFVRDKIAWVVSGGDMYVAEGSLGVYFAKEDKVIGPFEGSDERYIYMDERNICASSENNILCFDGDNVMRYLKGGIITSIGDDKITLITSQGIEGKPLSYGKVESPLAVFPLGRGYFISVPEKVVPKLQGATGLQFTKDKLVILSDAGVKDTVEGTYQLKQALLPQLIPVVENIKSALASYIDADMWKVSVGSMEDTYPQFTIEFPLKVSDVNASLSDITEKLQAVGLRKVDNIAPNEIAHYIMEKEGMDIGLELLKDKVVINVLVTK